jgi:hypothetical protein
MKIFDGTAIRAVSYHCEMATRVTVGSGEPPVRSEAHGPHWVAWIPDAAGGPQASVVLVAATRKEAEERARRWAEERAR